MYSFLNEKANDYSLAASYIPLFYHEKKNEKY